MANKWRHGMLLLLFLVSITAAEVKIKKDVVYGHKAGLAKTFDVYTPAAPIGRGVIFVVSGGWVSRWAPPEQSMPFVSPLLDKGFTVFAVRHGSSPHFKVPEAIKDMRQSVRYIRLHAKEFGIAPDKLGVMGMSAGGHLSLILATTGDDGNSKATTDMAKTSCRVAAAVALAPPTDLSPWVGTTDMSRRFPALQYDKKLAEATSPLFQVSQDDAPCLLIHGGADKLVPVAHSEKMKAELVKKNVAHDLIIFPKLDHGFSLTAFAKSYQSAVKWFDKHLDVTRQ